jgi:LysM repeat protein
MKTRTILLSVFLTGIFLCPAAFAMGGPAVEIHKNITSEVQTPTAEAHTALVTGEAPISATDKAKEDLASLEVQSEVCNGYLMVLNRKIIEAKKEGNADKLAELSAMERAMSEQESKVVLRISDIIQAHPELKPPEEPTIESTVTKMPAQKPELKTAGKSTAEASGKKKKPEQAKKPKTASHVIVYYVVKKGETLKSIARKCMGSESFYKEIARLNGITKARQFKPGIRLKIYKHNAK